jgi:fibronectin type 3 domain-containing protein
VLYRGWDPNHISLYATLAPDARQFTDTGLVNGVAWWYDLRAVNALGEGAGSGFWAMAYTVPSAPLNPAATPGSSQIVLSWSPPASDGGVIMEGYNVYRSLDGISFDYLVSVSYDQTSYVDGGVIAGTRYYYEISAVNGVGEGPVSEIVSAMPGATTTPPRSLQALTGQTSILLVWSVPASDNGYPVTGYKVYRGTSSGGETYLATALSTAYLDYSAVGGTKYYYKVTAVNAWGESGFSNEVSATILVIPSAPLNLVAVGGTGRIDLSWSAPASDGGTPVTGYNIYRGTSPGEETFYASVSGTTLVYADTAVSNWVYYSYYVTAVNVKGEGPASYSESVTPISVPGAPDDLAADTAYELGSVMLTWTLDPLQDGGSDVSICNVYRGTAPGAETLLYSGNFKLPRYLDQDVVAGTTYYYRVSGTNLVGEGPLSNEVSATPLGVPSAPQNLVADAEYFEGYPDPSDGTWVMHLSWSPPASDGGTAIIGYNIYRGTTSGGEAFLTAVGNVASYQDNAVVAGVTYYYRISAANAIGEGDMSAEASDTTASPPGPPILVQAVGGVGQITVSWTQPLYNGGTPITGYEIYRGTTSNGETYLASVGSSIRSYVDSAVVAGTTYYYKVRAVNAVGPGSYSSEVSAVSIAGPSAPQNLVATAGAQQVVLTWSAPASDGGSAITSYKIYRGTSSNGETYLTSVSSSLLTYTDTGLTAGTRYYYKVTAVNAVGESSYSNEASAIPTAPSAPTAPQNLAASSVTGSISLTWQPPSSDGGSTITAYKIYRGTKANSLTLLTTVPGTTLTYPDAAVTLNKKYYYQVSAVNSIGEGARSNLVSCTYTGGPPTVPTAPQNLAAAPGNGQITLTWAAPSSNGGSAITAYKIYRGATSGGETYLTQVSGTTLTYTNTGLTNGATYFYKVTAVNAVGEGPFSNEASAVPTSASKPTAPLGLTASVSGTAIHLVWSPPASNGGSQITAYMIYRGTRSGQETYLTTVPGSLTSYDDSTVSKGRTYYYKVSAVNAVGEGPLSNEASAMVPRTAAAAAFDSAAGIAVDVSEPAMDVLNLGWTAPSSSADDELAATIGWHPTR